LTFIGSVLPELLYAIRLQWSGSNLPDSESHLLLKRFDRGLQLFYAFDF
jgi:hypothetical protein